MSGNRNSFHIHFVAFATALSFGLDHPTFGAPAGNPSQLDLLRQQQMYANWQNSTNTSQHYGVVTSNIERIENAINNAQKNLSDTDYYDFQSRLYRLKQDASLELSRGADGSTQLGPAQSLETEITNRIREAAPVAGTKKNTLEAFAIRLESILNSKAERLSSDVLDLFRSQLSEFKTKIAQPSAYSDEMQFNNLMREGTELESSIRNRSMFGIGRGHLTFTRDEEPKKSEDKDSSAQQSETKTTTTTTTTTSTSSATPARGPKKPPVPLHKLIEQIENELMEFHDKRQLGSFDIDSFSGKLLGIKRNLQVMMSKNGRLSIRQEAVVREELESLHQEITDRVLGKN